MRLGLQIPDFTFPGGPAQLGADLARIARTADDAGFEWVGVMDHFFQIRGIGPSEREMLEAYTTLGFLAAHTNRAKLIPTPEMPRKLEVLREHCEREGRDYDEILKTCVYQFDVGPDGEHAGRLIEDLHRLSEMGIQAAIGGVRDVWRIKPLEVIGAE